MHNFRSHLHHLYRCLNFAACAAGGLNVNSTSTGVNSSSSDQMPVSDLRRLWAMVSKPDFGQPADSPDEVRIDSDHPNCKMNKAGSL
jgi:hypothetical protein